MFTYDQHHIDAFGDTVRLLAQQKISKLEGSILTRDDVGAAIDHWDRLGQIAFKKRTGRFAPVVFNELPHSRRQVVLANYGADVPIAHSDILRMKADPTDRYVMAVVAAGNRKKDELILIAAIGTATSVDHSNNNAKTLVPLPAAQKILHGGVGMTQSKVDQAYQKLIDKDVEDEELVAVVTQRQIRDLFGESGAKVVSRDFNVQQPMINGKIMGMWGGFNWIVSNRVNLNGTTRECVFMARPAVGFSYNQQSLMIEIKDRPDLEKTAQISADFDGEATRVEDEMVVQVECTE